MSIKIAGTFPQRTHLFLEWKNPAILIGLSSVASFFSFRVFRMPLSALATAWYHSFRIPRVGYAAEFVLDVPLSMYFTTSDSSSLRQCCITFSVCAAAYSVR